MVRSAALGLLLVVSAIASPVAVGANTAAVGGSGGSSYSIQCDSGMLLVGIYVAYGLWMDLVGARCASARDAVTGTWDNASDFPSVGYPHLGTTRKQGTCPAGYAVKSFKVSSGSFVNSISLTCNRLGQSWRTTTSTVQLAKLGATGGTARTAQACSGSSHAIGIHGRKGEFIDAFGLICGSVPPSTPALQAPVNGLRVTSRRPTFYWTGAARNLGRTTVCLNPTQVSDCLATAAVTGTVDYTSSNWTPVQDLPFASGIRIYWMVKICNDNACRTRSSYFTAL
ncbi:MAG: hypothetical protein EPO25_15745 [Gammaproteobacteria bacterium]|nr:MAG: hypothetical protein EPO25_15745 [Gammaproteobacteria bacterium]